MTKCLMEFPYNLQKSNLSAISVAEPFPTSSTYPPKSTEKGIPEFVPNLSIRGRKLKTSRSSSVDANKVSSGTILDGFAIDQRPSQRSTTRLRSSGDKRGIVTANHVSSINNFNPETSADAVKYRNSTHNKYVTSFCNKVIMQKQLKSPKPTNNNYSHTLLMNTSKLSFSGVQRMSNNNNNNNSKRPSTCILLEQSKGSTTTWFPRGSRNGAETSRRKENSRPKCSILPHVGTEISFREDNLAVTARCKNCSQMARKLLTHSKVAETLQKQIGFLENIVVQKRNLVEHLTRQLKTLLKENDQIAKSGRHRTSKSDHHSSQQASDHSSQQASDHSSQHPCFSSEEHKEAPRIGTNTTDVLSSWDGGNPVQSLNAAPNNEIMRVEFPRQKLEEASETIASLSQKCEELRKNYHKMKKQSLHDKRFLTDLLYTLNARGYESIRDYDGAIIDLHRCQGDSFLDLRGRDSKMRILNKRVPPYDMFFKAIIGSQERIIQNLVLQLQRQQDHDHARDSSNNNDNNKIEATEPHKV